MDFQEIIKTNQFSDGLPSRLHFGRLKIAATPSAGEYQIDWNYSEEATEFFLGEKGGELVDSLGSQRLILGLKKEILKFQILLPDKASIFKSEKPIKIPPKGRTRLFVFVPCFIQISGSSHFKSPLFEKPSIPLPQTWIGDMETGSLGYFLNASFYVQPDNMENKYYLAVCAINIQNNSKSHLDFDKLALPTAQMQLFQGKKLFYTNEIIVEYEGEVDGIGIKLKKSPPDLESGISLVCPPRQPQEAGIFKNTWDVFYKIARA